MSNLHNLQVVVQVLVCLLNFVFHLILLLFDGFILKVKEKRKEYIK